MQSNSNFSLHDVYVGKRLSKLRLNFSHLNEQKFNMVLKMELTACAIVALPQKQH